MLSAFRNMLRIPELRRRLFFTAALLAVFRFGCHVPTPGIDAGALSQFFDQAKTGSLLPLADLFAGGALSNAAIFALGIMPYISASIILQLLTAVVPSLERIAKEGESGRRKIQQYTRFLTVPICLFQSVGIAKLLQNPDTFGGVVLLEDGWGPRLIVMVTLSAGTMFVMWLGEQITERGIGNGISLIICANIVSRMPTALFRAVELLKVGQLKPGLLLVLMVLTAMMTAAVVMLTQAQRRIPVQHAKRIVGRRMVAPQSSYIPLRVNQAGMIPVIFASSILSFPMTFQFFSPGLTEKIDYWFKMGGPLYNTLYFVLIVFFCYFYTAITFNPADIADNMKKYGSFVPGIRPGRPTADYFYRVMNRITLVGAVGLALIAIMPMAVWKILDIDYLVASFCGGTGTIIVVGVVLDTVRQIESHLLMRHYDGFMRHGRVRGRR